MKPFYAIVWNYRNKLNFVGTEPITSLEEAVRIKDEIFPKADYFIVECKRIVLKKKTEKRILTVKEFLKLGKTSKDIVIECKKNGKFRCKCKGSVSELKRNAKKISWSDEDGDPEILASLNEQIKDIPDANSSEFTYTVYIEEKK